MKKQEWLISCTVVLVVALTMAVHGQEVAREPRVLVTFPEPLVELWPGEDGQILAQTTKHLYLWSEDKGIKELAVLDELHKLPRSNVDWSPQRIALLGQSKENYNQTKVSIVAPLPAHELIIPSTIRVDLISEAGVAFSRQYNPTTARGAETLLAYDFDGKLVENLCKKDEGRYLVSVGTVENKPAIAIAYNDRSTFLKFWLHHGKDKSDWETTLKLPNPNWELGKMQIVPQRQSIIMTIYSTGDKEFFYSQLWAISMKDGNLITRVSLPLPHGQPSGLYFRISADGRYGVFWGGSVVSVIDLTTWRVLWSTDVGEGIRTWMWIRSADVTSDGRVSAVFAGNQTESKMELYSFSTDGKATMVWASKETTDHMGQSIGKSLFYSTDGKSVLFRYRDSILKW